MAATHGYRSREKRKMGIPEKDKYRAGKIHQGPKEIDKVLSFEMKLKRIYIKWANEEGQVIWGCGECSFAG